MYGVDIKNDVKVDFDVTINNQPANDVLDNICDWCHDGLMYTSITRQECEDNPCLNNADTWKEQCEYLEGLLCRILNELGD